MIMDSSNTLNYDEPLKADIRLSIHDPITHGGPKALQDPLQLSIGPITRARDKKFKEALYGLIRGLWNNGQANHIQDGTNPFPKLI